MERKTCFVIDFTHPPKETEVQHFWLDDEYWHAWEEREQVVGGEVKLDITITPMPHRMFNLQFRYDGYVVVPCDRCLEPLEVPLDFEDEMRVVIGDELDDSDDEQITLNAQEPIYDFEWIIYELILVHLPLQMMHDISDCNPVMTKYLVDFHSEMEEDSDNVEEI